LRFEKKNSFNLRILAENTLSAHVEDFEGFQQFSFIISTVQFVLEQFDESVEVEWALGFGNHGLQVRLLNGLAQLFEASLQFLVVNGTITILVNDAKSLLMNAPKLN
jgi:hypothetical protein